MSQAVRDFEKTLVADAAITKFLVVKVTSTGVDVATANTDAMVGVSQNTAAITEACTFRFAGTTKATASAAISAGARVTATTGGKVVTTTTDKQAIIGVALEAASADGDYIEILLSPMAMISI
ncbi:hypothetical protein ACVWZV_002222 [Bradyrhizobium sp. GM5.1]